MNALKASGSTLHGPPLLSRVPFVATVSIGGDNDDILGDNDEDESLEDINRQSDGHDPATSCAQHNTDSLSQVTHPQEQLHKEDRRPTVELKVRNVHSFFENFRQGSSNTYKNPISELQSRYVAMQHQQNPQAEHKSVKHWFRDHQCGDLHDHWWTSEIIISNDISEGMGVLDSNHHSSNNVPTNGSSSLRCHVITSGIFPLTTAEINALRDANENDLLLDLCGKYKIVSTNDSNGTTKEAVWFKKKDASRRSAALNLLIVMDLGGCNYEDALPTAAEANTTASLLEKNGGISNEPKLIIGYYGAVKDPNGEFLSADNPCMLQCILKVLDSGGNGDLEVRSDFKHSRYDALCDAKDKIEHMLIISEPPLDRNEIIRTALLDKSIQKSNPQTIGFEVVVPDWASAEIIGSEFFLYELEFYLQNDGNGDERSACKSSNRIPMSQAMGLETEAATKCGIILGVDLFKGNESSEIESEFILPKLTNTSTGKEYNNACIHVRMSNKTPLNLSQMVQQIKCKYPTIKLSEGEDPVTLMKCFNIVLFNDYKSVSNHFDTAWDNMIGRLDHLEKASSVRRTCLFLPLTRNSQVDWTTVWDTVHHKPSRALWRFDMDICLPSSLRWTSFALFLVAIMACVPASSVLLATCLEHVNESHDYQRNSYTDDFKYSYSSIGKIEIFVLCITLPLITILTAIDVLVKPKKISMAALHNRFLQQQIGFKNQIFTTKGGEPNTLATSLSTLLPETILKIFCQGMNLDVISYATYYGKKQDCPLRHPSAPLIPATLVVSHVKHNFMSEKYDPVVKRKQNSLYDAIAARGYLVPELTTILPMPRDLLYLCQNTSKFMPKLERASQLIIVASRLNAIKDNACKLLEYTAATVAPPISEQVRLIDQATTIYDSATATAAPSREYERLETLGDCVLLFIIVVNIFANNAPNVVDCGIEKFEMVITMQGRNKVLFRAGMMIGLNRLASVGNASNATSWKSMYETQQAFDIAAKAETVNEDQSQSKFLSIDVSKKKISDLFESLLGATYLIDSTGCMTVGLLNEVGTCFPKFDCIPVGGEWFGLNKGACLKDGFPFNKHSDWAQEIKNAQHILQTNQQIIGALERSASALCRILLHLSKRTDIIDTLQTHRIASLLLQCAMFDYGFGNDDGIMDAEDKKRLECLAILREKIFHVGNASLQLKVVDELYHRHRTATSGDLHLMKLCVLSHDSLAYVLVKNGFHECLFDSETYAITPFQRYMYESDLLGGQEWNKRGGWILPGGIPEFQRRAQCTVGGNDETCGLVQQDCTPKYKGLAAGRLWGHKKKLPDDAVDDLQFSMKCICGALVLSVGLENAWALLKPVFLELLILSPEELRRSYEGISSLVGNQGKGKR